MAAKTKDGLPRKAFAYAPTADPSTWKLPFLTAEGKPDPDHLPGAAAAIGEGFRGQKADVPAGDVPAVKARLRAAYRKWKGSDVEYPDGIKETALSADDGSELREATILLDRGSVYAKVIFAPNGDALVIPDYDGAFYSASMPWTPPNGDVDWNAAWNAQDASTMIGKLAVMKQGEKDEPEDAAVIDKAINALQQLVKNETAEIVPATTAEAANALAYALSGDDEIVEAAFAEVGKRNSSKDSTRIQSMHDLAHDLGASHEKGKTYAGMAESSGNGPIPETVHVIETTDAAGEAITFRESTYDSALLVDLREADPQWTEDGKSVWITPIQPGFGNTRDNFFYPEGTLREATEAGLFNGLKMYRNHPRKSDKTELPERDVTDWFATTKESAWDPARKKPRVLVAVHDESDRNRFHDAPEQIAFSIIGGGHARPGRVDGRDTRVVESFTNVASVDWVTEAGAGGALDFTESAALEEPDMTEIAKMTTAELKAANPTLYASIVAEAAKVEPDPKPEPEPKPGEPEPKTEPVTEAAVPDWAKTIVAFVSESQAEKAAAKQVVALTESKPAAAAIVDAAITESTLIAKGKAAVKAHFADATIGDGGTFATEDALKEAITADLTSTQALVASLLGDKGSGVKGLGAAAENTDVAPREAALKDLAARYGGTDAPKKTKHVFAPGEDLSEMGNTTVVGGSEGERATVAESGSPAEAETPSGLEAAYAAIG